jgi:hypothetical protein
MNAFFIYIMSVLKYTQKYPNEKHEETRYVKRTQKITQCL